MYEVRFRDGTIREVFADELTPITKAKTSRPCGVSTWADVAKHKGCAKTCE